MDVEFDKDYKFCKFFKSVEKCENEKRKTASEVLSRPRAPRWVNLKGLTPNTTDISLTNQESRSKLISARLDTAD